MTDNTQIKAADVVLAQTPEGQGHHAHAMVIAVKRRLLGKPLVKLVYARRCKRNEAGYSPQQFILGSQDEIEQAGLPFAARFDLREVVIKPLDAIDGKTGRVDLNDSSTRKRFNTATRAAHHIL